MQFKEIQKLSSNQKSSIVTEISNEYNKYVGLKDLTTKKEASIVLFVNSILRLLEKEQREVLENDFIKAKGEEWWKEKYCEKDYLSIKTKAIDNFTYYVLL